MHVPVMPREVLHWLAPQRGEILLDATVGLGGHAALLAPALGPTGLLLGLDRDRQALAHARARLAQAPCRVRLLHSRMSDLAGAAARAGCEQVRRLFMDLGVSSLQLDTPARGFSLMRSGPLDMRMDPSQGQPASALVNRLPEAELARIFRELGEERHARRIARSIVEARRSGPINTTDALAAICRRAVRGHQRMHPARRVFQALRVAVNDELGELRAGLAAARRLLAPGGRLVVLSFHSLEDRIVKHQLRDWSSSGDFVLPHRRVIKPGGEECNGNPRARSAKLRVCEKVAAPP